MEVEDDRKLAPRDHPSEAVNQHGPPHIARKNKFASIAGESEPKTILNDVKEWVAANITRWRMENPEWLKLELIEDELLPS